MNNLPAPSLPTPEILPPGTLDIVQLDEKVKHTAKILRTSMMRLAYYGWRLRYAMGDDWSPLGYESEDDYRDSLGIGRSNWYKYIAIGQALQQLTLEDLQEIPVSNAELLLQVDNSLWHDYPWVVEAKELSSSDLAGLVAQRNKRHGIDRQPMGYYRCRIPVTAKKFLEETVESFRLEHELASSGEALEFLIADVHDRPNVMSAVHKAQKYISWAMWRFSRRGDSTELQWLYAAQRLLDGAYKAVRMEHVNAKNEEEVYPAENQQDREDFAKWSGSVPEQPSRPAGTKSAGSAGMEGSIGNMRTVSPADEVDRHENDDEAGGYQG